MDLARLGKVAGIGGIAIGAAVLVLRPLIESALPGLEPEARAHAVLVIAYGAFALGILGIAAWAASGLAGRGGQSIKAGRDAAIAGRDAVVGSRLNGVGPNAGGGTSKPSAGRREDFAQTIKAGRDAAIAGGNAIVGSKINQPESGEAGSLQSSTGVKPRRRS